MSDWIRTEREGPVARVVLARPELHNAFNDEMIANLTGIFREWGQDTSIRAIVLAAAGKSFCAGADLNWMRSMLTYSYEENVADARRLGDMLHAIATCPRPVIGRIHGAAFGGGVGLTSVCDMTVAVQSATFCLSEVKLGLLPAVISPFVLRKIPRSQASRYFLTAERFSAEEAQRIGLVSSVVQTEAEMDAQIGAWVEALCQNGPEAVEHCKSLIESISQADTLTTALDDAVRRIADRRISPEGQEGMRAFLEKRSPQWQLAEPSGHVS